MAGMGCIVNLFNLIPIPPLDGGRTAAAMTSKVWLLGVISLCFTIPFLIYIHAWIMLVLLPLMAYPEIKRTYLLSRVSRKSYYGCIPKQRLYARGGYLLVAGSLTALMWFTLSVEASPHYTWVLAAIYGSSIGIALMAKSWPVGYGWALRALSSLRADRV